MRTPLTLTDALTVTGSGQPGSESHKCHAHATHITATPHHNRVGRRETEGDPISSTRHTSAEADTVHEDDMQADADADAGQPSHVT